MKILFIDRYGATSIWSLLASVAKNCISHGDEVTFCYWRDGRNSVINDIPENISEITLHVGSKTKFYDIFFQHYKFTKELIKIIRDMRPDIIHTNFAVPGIISRIIGRIMKVPHVVSTQHELYDSLSWYYRMGLKLTENCADAVVYVSSAVARSFSVNYVRAGCYDKNVIPSHVVIYNGIDIDKIESIKKHITSTVSGKIVCIGRMVPEKGQITLLRAMPEIIDKYPEIKLKLIGSGPMEAELQHIAGQLNISQYVEFTGWLSRDETINEIATSNALIVPSDGTQEGFGLVVVEAMACGVPVLVSKIPLFEELLGNDYCDGRSFNVGDHTSLANELCALLDNPHESKRRADNARENAVNKFSSVNMVSAYEDLYHSLTRDM